MTQAPLDVVVRQARHLTQPHATHLRADGDLLLDFLAANDQPAFEAIVRRHGSMVLGLCRRVLGNAEDAEDAFQATFLVLARHAGTIRKRGSLASWLYGVAYRMANNARKTAARRRQHERRAAVHSSVAAPDSSPAEWQAILDEEVEGLPEVYREAFVLCCLEQVTSAEAARRLGCKEGTVCSRLARARKLLRERLARRGVSLSAVLTATALGGTTASAAVPARLLAGTVQVAAHLAAGGALTRDLVSAGVLALVNGSGRKATVVLLGAALLLAVGATIAAPGTSPPRPDSFSSKAFRALPPPREESVEVNGVVLDADGKPAEGAKLLVWTKRAGSRANLTERARANADGKFRMTLREDEVFDGARILAEGRSGVDWAVVRDAKAGRDLTLRLRVDDVLLTGRVLDLEGRPIAGVTLEILSVGQTTNDVTLWIDNFVTRWKQGQWVGWSGLTTIAPEALGTKSPVTGKDGTFRIAGVGRDRVVTLQTRSEKTEAMEFQVVAKAGPKTGWKPGYLGLYATGNDVLVGPTKPIVGTVRNRHTGKPAPGVRVACVTQRSRAMEATTDENGRYRIVGAPKEKSYTISIAGKRGFPYLDYTRLDVPDTEGLVPLVVDLDAERGVEITGRVLAKDGRKPVRGQVRYTERPDNPHLKDFVTFKGLKHLISDWGRVEADGTFRVVGIPGRGILTVHAEERHRFVQLDPWREARKRGLDRSSDAHAIVPIDVPVKQAEKSVGDVLLEPAQEVSGRVVDPDGKPVTGAVIAGLRDPSALVEHSVSIDEEAKSAKILKLKGSTFTARSRQAGETTGLVFYHPEKKLARIVTPGASGNGEVKLERCATVSGRVLDEKGKPMAGMKVYVQTRALVEEMDRLDLPLYELNTTGMFHLVNRRVKTDADGRFRAEGLFPGWPYHLFVVEADGDRVHHVVKTLGVEAGKARDLGDLKRNVEAPKREK